MSQKIVFLSGLAGTSAVWQPLAELCTDYKLSIPAVPWSVGNSEWQNDPTTVSDFLAQSCSGADVIVAHSFAATLLLEYLATSNRHGKAIPGAAVLVSTFYRPNAQDFRWVDIEHFLTHFDRILTCGIHASSTRTLGDERAGDMARIVREQVGPYGWMAFYSAYLRTPLLDPYAVECPVSLVHGAQDSAAPIRDSRDLADSFESAGFHVLADIGHFPMKDASGSVFEAIRSVMPEPISMTGECPSRKGAFQ